MSRKKNLSRSTEVADLVERFRRNLEVYRRPEYKEARVRAEFIDPFSEALGWDVRNVRGYAEQYKDVVHEDAITVGGAAIPADKQLCRRQIDATDRQIDQLVYELYELTDPEIRIVEGE